ncbi:hypothetical protein ABOB58_27555, partial [Escherichia coli]
SDPGPVFHTIVSIKNDGHYFCRAGGNRPDGLNEPVTSAITGDLNFISTDRVLNTGIIERFCFLMLCRKPAAHAVNTDAPVRLRGFSGR